MERETDQYMNADEYVQELLINVRSLAGEYLNWKKQSVFAGEGRIRDTEVSREGILELSQILRRGKHSFEEMHRKAEQSVRRRTVIPLEYLFHIKKAGKYLKHCVSLALAAELDRNSGELFQEIPENYKKIYPTLELGLCLYTADSRARIECMRNMLEEKETFDFFFGTGNSRESRTEMRLDPRILQFLLSPETEPEKLEGFCRLYDGSDLEEQPMVIREDQMERTAALLGTVPEEKKILYLFGHPGSGRRFMIRHACRKLGRFCLEADIGKLDGNDPGKLLDEMIRETQIRRAVLCIRNFQLLFQNGKMYQAWGCRKGPYASSPGDPAGRSDMALQPGRIPGAGHGTGDFASGYWGADHSVGGGAETAPGGNAGNISNRTCTARDPCRKIHIPPGPDHVCRR